jgi:DNA primase large subunit
VSATVAEDTLTPPRLMDHGEYECPGCRRMAEYPIVVDVYGCAAGRHCTVVTPEKRFEFEQQIAERLDARRRTQPEES